MFNNEPALCVVSLAARIEHEKRQQMRIEDPHLMAGKHGFCTYEQTVGGGFLFSLEFELNQWRRQVAPQCVI